MRPIPQKGSTGSPENGLAIDQTGNSSNAISVMPPMMTIHLVQGLETTQTTYGVFDDDAKGSEGHIVGSMLGRMGFAARLAAWDKGQGIELVQLQIEE